MNSIDAKTAARLDSEILLGAATQVVLRIANRSLSRSDLSIEEVVAGTKARYECVASDKIWCDVRSGAFVTAYKALPPSSENVWCCMSNGQYGSDRPLLANVIDSAVICATQDSRRTQQLPVASEVCGFAPKSLWIDRSVDGSDLCRSLQRAIMVQTDNGRSAVYLPEVWDERPEWSGRDLIDNLTRKAGGRSSHVDRVMEIPCYVVASPQIDVPKADRGLFASLVLQRALAFYDCFKSANRLAYQVVPPKKQADTVTAAAAATACGNGAVYDNEGAFVRSYADVSAYFKLCRLLAPTKDCAQQDSIVQFAETQYPDGPDGAVAAARVSFLLDVNRPDSISTSLVASLLDAVPHRDKSFAQPQIILSLCRCILTDSVATRLNKQTRERILGLAKQFVGGENGADGSKIGSAMALDAQLALQQHGVFAANWLLQAFASARSALQRTRFNCREPWPHWVLAAQQVCRQSIDFPDSVTAQACAAHGLLAVGQFDHVRYNWLPGSWKRLQDRFDMRGGFAYHVPSSSREPLFRTDVTSHVVEVCLLLRAESCLHSGVPNLAKNHVVKLHRLGLMLSNE